MAYLPALIVAGAAVLVLAALPLTLIGPIRRFRSAVAEYRARLHTDAAALLSGREELRERLGRLLPSRSGGNGGYDRLAGETEERNA